MNNSHRFHRLIKRTRISLIARINNFAIPQEYPIDGQDLCEIIIREIREIRVRKNKSVLLLFCLYPVNLSVPTVRP